MNEGRSLVNIFRDGTGNITVMYDLRETTADDRLRIYGLMEVAKAGMLKMEAFGVPAPSQNRESERGDICRPSSN